MLERHCTFFWHFTVIRSSSSSKLLDSFTDYKYIVGVFWLACLTGQSLLRHEEWLDERENVVWIVPCSSWEEWKPPTEQALEYTNKIACQRKEMHMWKLPRLWCSVSDQLLSGLYQKKCWPQKLQCTGHVLSQTWTTCEGLPSSRTECVPWCSHISYLRCAWPVPAMLAAPDWGTKLETTAS